MHLQARDSGIILRADVYIARIDTIRALAALSVIYIHYFSPFVPRCANVIIDGVQLFFVLSGFLITRSLLTASRNSPFRIKLRNFYIRRFFRICPVYYATILICCLFALYGSIPTLPWALTYTTNFMLFFKITDAGYLGHLWTLAVEEQFYLVLPFMLLLLPRIWFVAAAMVAVVIAVMFRMIEFSREEMLWANTLASIDKLAVGSLACVAVQSWGSGRTEKFLRLFLPLTIPSFVLCSCMPILGLQIRQFAIGVPTVMTSLFFAWLIVKAVHEGPLGSSWGGSLLPAIGAVSYGVYLFHLPMTAAVHYFEGEIPLRFLCVWGR